MLYNSLDPVNQFYNLTLSVNLRVLPAEAFVSVKLSASLLQNLPFQISAFRSRKMQFWFIQVRYINHKYIIVERNLP